MKLLAIAALAFASLFAGDTLEAPAPAISSYVVSACGKQDYRVYVFDISKDIVTFKYVSVGPGEVVAIEKLNTAPLVKLGATKEGYNILLFKGNLAGDDTEFFALQFENKIVAVMSWVGSDGVAIHLPMYGIKGDDSLTDKVGAAGVDMCQDIRKSDDKGQLLADFLAHKN